MHVQIGFARSPKVGETVCGDAFVVVPFSSGTLLCLADGLGHGPQAYAAAEAACEYARAHVEQPLEALMRGIDRTLVGTRGAAVSLVALVSAPERARFVGIGNVELRARSRVHISPPTTPGIVGQRLRVVRVWDYQLSDGDLLVLFSDGISGRFDLDEFSPLDPQALATALLAKHRHHHDDACCVVARLSATAAVVSA